MKAYTVIHWVLISLLVMAVAACTSENLLEKASTALEDQRYEDAKKYARQYAMANSNSFEAHMILGKAFMNSSASDSDDDVFTARYYFREAGELAASDRHQTDEWKKNKKRDALLWYTMAQYQGKPKELSKKLLELMEKDLLSGKYEFVHKTYELFTNKENNFFKEATLTNISALLLNGDIEKCMSDMALLDLPGNNADYRAKRLKKDFISRTLNYLELVSTGSKNTGKPLKELKEKYKYEGINDKEARLYARGWEIIGETAEDSGLKDQAKTSYKEARQLYIKADQNEKARQMEKRIKSL